MDWWIGGLMGVLEWIVGLVDKWRLVARDWMLDAGYWMLVARDWILDAGCWDGWGMAQSIHR
jgi:hypothetical protein